MFYYLNNNIFQIIKNTVLKTDFIVIIFIVKYCYNTLKKNFFFSETLLELSQTSGMLKT